MRGETPHESTAVFSQGSALTKTLGIAIIGDIMTLEEALKEIRHLNITDIRVEDPGDYEHLHIHISVPGTTLTITVAADKAIGSDFTWEFAINDS